MIKKFIQYLYRRLKPSKNYAYCKRCGRRLISQYSIVLGLGKCCLRKETTKSTKPLF